MMMLLSTCRPNNQHESPPSPRCPLSAVRCPLHGRSRCDDLVTRHRRSDDNRCFSQVQVQPTTPLTTPAISLLLTHLIQPSLARSAMGGKRKLPLDGGKVRGGARAMGAANHQPINNTSRAPSTDKHFTEPRQRSETARDDEDDGLLKPKQHSSGSDSPAKGQLRSDRRAEDGSSDNDDDASDSADELKVHIIERPAHAMPPTRHTTSLQSAMEVEVEVDDADELEQEEDYSEDEVGLTINKEYAAQFEADKRQQELSKKAQRGRKKSDMIALVQQEMGVMEDEDDEADEEDRSEGGEEDEDEDEDDEGALLTEELDVRIHETLNAIKRKDPRVYDKSTVFFADDENGEGAEGRGDKPEGDTGDKRKVTVKQLLLESMNGEEDEEESDDSRSVKPLTHVQEQAKLKRDLLNAANRDGEATTADKDDNEDDDDLFRVRITTTSSSSPSTALSSPPAAPLSSSAFLTSYLSHQWWKADPSTLPSWSAIRGEQPNPSLPSLSDEEEEEDREEAFEAAHNFRHQEEGGSEVKTWPRIIEDSVRRKDNTRKEARERKRETKDAERKRQEEELKRMKNDKLRGMQAKVKQVEEVSGVVLDEDVRRGLRLDKGWDEEEHERLMAQLFDNEYYNKGTADEDEEAAIERIRREEEEEDEKTAAKTAGGRGRLLSTVHPKLRQELLADMDELYALDYEDVIGGGAIKTRFHYTRVKPDTYGLTLDDILDKEDKELNKRISIKKLAPYRAENEPVEEDDGRRGGKVRGQQLGRGGGYHERRVEGVKRKLEAKKKEKQQQQPGSQEDGAGQTKGKKQAEFNGAKEEGANGTQQKSAKNGGAAAVVRVDGKLTATQKRRMREKNRKARLNGAATESAGAEASGASTSQPAKRHKSEQ